MEKLKKSVCIQEWGKDILADVLGALLYGAGVYVFAVNANFAPGGITGLAILVNHFFPFLPIGTLTVTPITVTITTSTETKPYDGTPLHGSFTVEGLPAGYNYAIAGGTMTGSQTEVGSSENTIDLNGIMFVDSESHAVDTSSWTIVVKLGTLTVTPAG